MQKIKMLPRKTLELMREDRKFHLALFVIISVEVIGIVLMCRAPEYRDAVDVYQTLFLIILEFVAMYYTGNLIAKHKNFRREAKEEPEEDFSDPETMPGI